MMRCKACKGKRRKRCPLQAWQNLLAGPPLPCHSYRILVVQPCRPRLYFYDRAYRLDWAKYNFRPFRSERQSDFIEFIPSRFIRDEFRFHHVRRRVPTLTDMYRTSLYSFG